MNELLMICLILNATHNTHTKNPAFQPSGTCPLSNSKEYAVTLYNNYFTTTRGSKGRQPLLQSGPSDQLKQNPKNQMVCKPLNGTQSKR